MPSENKGNKEIQTLHVVKLEVDQIPLLNYSVEDFIQEQDLSCPNVEKNQLFRGLIAPTIVNYEIEIKSIEEQYVQQRNAIVSQFPPGNYPIEIKQFVESHLQYNELLMNKTKCALRARVFDTIQNVFNQHINIDSIASLTAAMAAAANLNSTTIIAAANINKQNSGRKKKRKVDANLDRWYSLNQHSPYPMFQDKIFLSSISRISKLKLEEWLGNKRTRSRKSNSTSKVKKSKN